jgi:putative aldouronate transport system permease protein
VSTIRSTVQLRGLRGRARRGGPRARGESAAGRGKALRAIWNERLTYALLLPAVVSTALFAYWPMYGILLAFKEYRLSKGILGSPWMDTGGFGWFRIMFIDPDFLRVIANTVQISFVKLVLSTFSCILLAVLLSELRHAAFKRIVQSLLYLPHFLSWVIVSGLVYSIFSASGGVLPKLLSSVTSRPPLQILANPVYFRPLVYLSDLWKEVGFGTIIYLAAIAGINPEYYESAIIDGAGRFRRVVHITVPLIKSTIVLLLILSLSKLMNGGFDQILNLYSPQVFAVGDIIDTYVYRHGILGLEFSYSTAIELFKQVINIALLVVVNTFAKLVGEEGVY